MTQNLEPVLDLRLSAVRCFVGYLVAITCGLLFIGMGAVAMVLVFQGQVILGLILLLIPLFCARLGKACWRDARSIHGWRMKLTRDDLTVWLPAHRSYTHKLAPCHQTYPISEIAGIETRLETLSSFGRTYIQRSFVLRLAGGGFVLVGEDRLLGGKHWLGIVTIGEVVATLCEKLQIPLKNHEMAEG